MRTTIALVFLLVAACDSSDDSKSPASYCREFIDIVCTRGIACGDTDDDQRTCEATQEAQLTGGRGCGIALAVRDTDALDSCFAQLQSMTCAELDALASTPPECREQIILPE